MAIKYRYQCLTETISSNKAVTLKPKEDESIHITDIRVSPMAVSSPVYLDVSIDRHKVSRILLNRPNQATTALHNGLESANTGGYKIDPGLADFKIDYIVANGETITFSLNIGTQDIEIEYDIYDRDDLQATMPGGSKDGTYYYVAEYKATGTAPTLPGEYTVELIPDSNIPEQFLEPIRGNIGLNQRVECIGIGALPFSNSTPTAGNYIKSRRLIISKNREVLGNKDGNGVGLISDTPEPTSINTKAVINDFPLFPTYPHKTDVFDEMKVIRSGDKYKISVTYQQTSNVGISLAFRVFLFWKITQ